MVKHAFRAMLLLVGLGLAYRAEAAELVMSKYRVRCSAGIVAMSPGGKAIAFELGEPVAVLPVLMSDPAHFREQEYTAVQLHPDPLVTGWVRTAELPTVTVREVYLAPTTRAAVSEVGIHLGPGAAVTVLKRADGLTRVRYAARGFSAEGWIAADAVGTFFEAVSEQKQEALTFLSYMPDTATFLDAPREKPLVTVRGVPGSAIMTTGRIEKGYALAVWKDGPATVRGWFPEAKVVTKQEGLYGNVVMTADDRERLAIDVPGGTAVLDDVRGNVLGQFVLGTRNNVLLEQRDGSSRIYVWTRLGRFAAWVPIVPAAHPGPWAAKH